jgi:hypothetical protein
VSVVSSWEPVDLRVLEPRIERPMPGIGGLLYKGARHGFSGESESAKTTIAYALALEEIRAGGRLVLVDLEMGAYETVDRLHDMGASREELGSVTYLSPECAPPGAYLPVLIEDREPTLAIVDAAAGAYSVLGLDDGKRLDVEAFGRILIRPFHAAGVTTIVIDHVTKAKDGRSRYAIGSERKLGVVDVHLGFDPVRSFQRGREALVHVVTHKDRFGFLQRPRAGQVELRSDAETHRITWEFQPPAETSEPSEFRPTQLMEKVSRHLQRQSEAISRSAVLRGVSGKREWVLAAIEHLVVEGHARENPGPRGAKLLSHIRPFPDPSPPFSENGSPTSSPVPPAYGGERERVDWDEEAERLLKEHADIAEGRA